MFYEIDYFVKLGKYVEKYKGNMLNNISVIVLLQHIFGSLCTH